MVYCEDRFLYTGKIWMKRQNLACELQVHRNRKQNTHIFEIYSLGRKEFINKLTGF